MKVSRHHPHCPVAPKAKCVQKTNRITVISQEFRFGKEIYKKIDSVQTEQLKCYRP